MAQTYPPFADTAFLGTLAHVLLLALADSDDGFLVHTVAVPDGHRVGMLPLEGRSPTDALLGTVASEEWDVLGAGSKGWTRPLERAGQVGARDATAEVIVLVHRSGEVVGRLRRDGDTRILSDVPTYGAVLDCIQRAFGLPTAPPLVSTGHFFAALWLASAATAQLEASRTLTWLEVSRLHPACVLLHSDDGGYNGDLVLAAKALERVCDWERLRWMVVEGRFDIATLTPTQAAWLDDGSFSRWVIGALTPLPTLIDDVYWLTRPSTAERCARTLRKLGVLRRGHWRPPAQG